MNLPTPQQMVTEILNDDGAPSPLHDRLVACLADRDQAIRADERDRFTAAERDGKQRRAGAEAVIDMMRPEYPDAVRTATRRLGMIERGER